MAARPVAFGAWAGRKPDGGLAAVPDDAPDAPPQGIVVSPRDLISLLLLVLGGLAGMVGLAGWIGWPGILIAFWLTAVPVALVMGTGE